VSATFPGTTIEVSRLVKGCSRTLFDGIFATGGITLSQVSVMTGLEPNLIQNWVKRGFVSSPIKRVYSKEQFARIVIINMLREALQIEKICKLTAMLDFKNNGSDNTIGDDDLYHIYVDMISDSNIDFTDYKSVEQAAESALAGRGAVTEEKKRFIGILSVILYAHTASRLRFAAENMLSSID